MSIWKSPGERKGEGGMQREDEGIRGAFGHCGRHEGRLTGATQRNLEECHYTKVLRGDLKLNEKL